MKRAGLLSALVLVAGCAGGRSDTGTKGPTGLRPFGPAGITASGPPRRVALLIGVERFDDPRFGDLRFAQDDALALGARLSKEGFEEVRVLTGPDETTRAAVLDALHALSAQLRRPEDTVVVYVSSHGTLGHRPGQPLERFLVFRDTRMSLVAETGLAVKDLLARVDGLASSRKAVVLATCHSGEGKSQLSDPLVEALAGAKGSTLPRLYDVSEAMVVLSAAAFSETARESAELGHDIYTFFLLEALARGDRDGNGAVTVVEAHDYARARTYAFSGGQQRPTLVGTVLGEDPVVLAGRRARTPDPVLFGYSPAAEGVSVVVDGDVKGVLPGGVVVPAGRHTVQLLGAKGRRLWSAEVDLAAGVTTDVSTLIPPPPTYAVELQAYTTVPLEAATRERLLPAAFGGRAMVRAHDLWPGLQLSLGAGGAAGGGGLGDAAPPEWSQSVRLLQVTGGAAYRIPWGGFELVPGLQLGLLWVWRSLDLRTTRVDERLQGVTFGGSLGVERRIAEHLWLGLRAEVGGLVGDVGDRAVSPVAGGGLGLAYRL